jgi:hypothetical protein
MYIRRQTTPPQQQHRPPNCKISTILAPGTVEPDANHDPNGPQAITVPPMPTTTLAAKHEELLSG